MVAVVVVVMVMVMVMVVVVVMVMVMVMVMVTAAASAISMSLGCLFCLQLGLGAHKRADNPSLEFHHHTAARAELLRTRAAV